ncbi:hypothetical protein QFZ24_010081 [Streptomyces phaeochromogenes]|uniref:hypothetical protein n=1 Tax=Streptomyces phaeochromogenes TaxID=1923 RepID=UPI00278F8274|nr:hypothetical protein [Streptomyces phaeochromogenes]MDQ0956072.1 hypothetical protein [Streptomyces phaeochromogenes]
MTTSSFSSSRCRRIAAVASALILIALPAALLALVVGAGVPESWWPRTGRAFAADSPSGSGSGSGSAHQDPCDLIVGPAKKYCERGTSPTASCADESPRDGASTTWMVIPPAAGVAAVVVWRRRGAAGHGRR